MSKIDYDVLIVGAGIHGVGVAQAAAHQGWSVLLLEQFDSVACATSSRSSKLIHGGLRYLQTGQLKLVYDCLSEREKLLTLAPSLVKLTPFYIPVYKGGNFSSWMIRMALSLYAILGGLKKNCRFKKVHKKEWSKLDGLKTAGLISVFAYYDGQTDDRLLTEAVMHSAQENGAKVITNATFENAQKTEYIHDISKDIIGSTLKAYLEEERVSGYHVSYTTDRTVKSVSCQVLINATGPWINETAIKITPTVPIKPINLVQGSHIVLPIPAFKNIYYVESPIDHRVMFIMPWQGKIMIGTTEKTFKGEKKNPVPSTQEIEYLLACFNHYFPQHQCQQSDIYQKFAGIRVLPTEKNTSHFMHSRETDLLKGSNYIAIYGGKLTDYRLTAMKAVRQIASISNWKSPIKDTANLMLVNPKIPKI